MEQINQKDKVLFEYTNKIFSIQRAHFIQPFPKDIHKILTSYIQLCYYTCVFPFRLLYNPMLHQYEIKTSIIQRIAYSIVWTCSIVRYSAELISHIPTTKPGDPTGVLLLLGGIGHMGDLLTYLVTAAYYREEVKNLVNYLLLNSASSSDTPGQFGEPSYGASFGITGFMSYPFAVKRIGKLLWLMTLVAGIKSTQIDVKLFSGMPLINIADTLRIVPTGVKHAIEDTLKSSSFTSYLLSGFLNTVLFISMMDTFAGPFIYGLELIAVLTMKLIATHFTRALKSTDFWRPTSTNILSSFLILRTGYRMVNRIFGWMLFYTIMGEFPNFTFSLVFWYQNPDESIQWNYRVGVLYIFLILIFAALTINELSKLKEWMHGEHKKHWSLTKRDSLQRRIVLFELSLNRYAIYAHGFFQLSLPAFISIAAGMLSNTLIIIQLDLSKNKRSV